MTAFTPRKDLSSRLRRRMRREWTACGLARYRMSRPLGYELFSDDRTEYDADLLSQLPPCDVINMHWVAGFVGYEPFSTRAPKHTPVVWTLHDMNPFTGGCHYDYGCSRHADSCGACPQLGSDDAKDLSHQIWRRKRRVFEQVKSGRLRIVTPSRWLAKEAERSVLFGRFPISVVPYGLDTDVFSPRDRRIARAALEVPQDARVILFAADSTDNRRKGFALLTQALAGLANLAALFLVSLGSGMPAIGVSVPHMHLGYLANDRLLSLAYSAADLLVVSSLQDNLPNTVLESLACGTPVVGFNTGGIPDMVRPGVTGLLVPTGNIGGLREAIAELLRDSDARAEMSINCRRIAVEEYALEVQARRYVDLYEKMLTESRKS